MMQMRETLGKRIEIRAWGNDLSRWQQASLKAGYRSVSEWIRRTLNDEVTLSSFDRRNRTRFENSLREAVDQLTSPVYDRTVLENGITVVTESVPGVRAVSIGVLVDCGVRDEAPQENGLAHLCEHLLFHGTSSRDAAAIARQIDQAGSQAGAFTTRDYTCFHATVLDDYCFHTLDLLGDLLLNSVFPEPAIEREKRVIRREIAAAADDPSRSLHETLKLFMWPGEPVGRPIGGAENDVDRFTREEVIYFIQRHYTPDRIIIAAAGGVQHENFVAQARDVFWRLLGASEPSPRRALKPHTGVTMRLGAFRQAYFALGIPSLPYGHPDRYAMHILSRLLGAGMSSRLYRSLREERALVHSIQADYSAYRDAGLLAIEGSAEPGELRKTVSGLLESLWALASGELPVQEEELLLAKNQLRAEHMLAGESVQTRMSRIATQQLYFQTYFPTKDILQAIDSVEPETLERLASTVLADGLAQAGLAVLGPERAMEERDELRRLLTSFQERSHTWRRLHGSAGLRMPAASASAKREQVKAAAAGEPYLRRGSDLPE